MITVAWFQGAWSLDLSPTAFTVPVNGACACLARQQTFLKRLSPIHICAQSGTNSGFKGTLLGSNVAMNCERVQRQLVWFRKQSHSNALNRPRGARVDASLHCPPRLGLMAPWPLMRPSNVGQT